MNRTRQLIQMAQNGDQEAKEILIKENSGLVWSVVKRFKGRGYDMEDLYQLGAMGLLKAVYKFDMSYDVQFSTYAVPMIIGEIKRFLRDDGIVKISRPLKELCVKAKYVSDQIKLKTGEEPTISCLAKELGVESEELIMALESGKEVESIYSTVYQNDGSPVYLIDKIKNHDDSSNAVDIIALRQAVSTLDSKERQIIKMRYFEDKTQTEVAKVVGISQVQVSRLEKKVLQRIKEKIT